ncbi:hypothetical protein DCC81_03530 [Chitinophaga parva]|uniref:Uncharacterized protein n=1 Tax=Chitinophaga parva TaxID=2169414 RepID=A0A2T7BLK8_9BACT|nr:hypothetical protein [Chitinophaga parva]PUZ28565.1 hypothetical protein DCC81_03530 [Chitinophaga parva]
MRPRIPFLLPLLLALTLKHPGFAQGSAVHEYYDSAYDSLASLITKPDAESFKKAVFITENAFTLGGMRYEKFNSHIGMLAAVIKAWMTANPVKNYHYSDSNNFEKNFAIYRFLKDTIHLIGKDGQAYNLLPYTYDFTDYTGSKDWGYMFVTKLLATKSGNCHSLPYLYKILADEIGASCWLALAPNHIYIQNRCKKIGWYNTELTSGCFPIDAWIMASGYLPLQAVQSGIYMDTLGSQQSIGLCILDLAKGYEHKTHNYTDGFILKACDLSLKYFPLNVQAMLLKAETLKHVYEEQKAHGLPLAKKTFTEMEAIYMRLLDLGYREMPDQMYVQWLQSVTRERDKYANKLISGATQGNN